MDLFVTTFIFSGTWAAISGTLSQANFTKRDGTQDMKLVVGCGYEGKLPYHVVITFALLIINAAWAYGTAVSHASRVSWHVGLCSC